MPPRSAIAPSSARSGAESGYPDSRRRSTSRTGGKAAAEPLAQLEPLEALPALRPRRRAPVHRDRPLERGPLGGDGARVVAGIGLLLERGVVLLVHANEAEPAHRREDRRPRADDDPRVAAGDPLPLVAALGVGQARVQERNRVAEPRAEATDRLRRERDLGHEHDRPQPALERGRRSLEVDLCLAAPGRAVEQEVAAALVESAHDPFKRSLLVGAQALRSRLALERLPLDRRALLLAALSPHGRDSSSARAGVEP